MFKHIQVLASEQITVNADFSVNAPDNPIIRFNEGDVTGFEIYLKIYYFQ